MAKTETIGSWFSSGYHGHFRSKSRSDFINEFRHLAKPQPPGSFVQRAREPSARHVFSTHDNRHSFLNDAQIFSEGLGRRRIANNTTKSDRALLHWSPMREEMARQGPVLSAYKTDYRGVPFQPPRQQIIRRPKTSFDEGAGNTTSYRYAHGSSNPNKATLSAMSNVGLSTGPNRIIKSSVISGRESVASCMSWHRPVTAGPRSNVPAATQTVTMDPSPPKTSAPATMNHCGTNTVVKVPHPPTTAPAAPAPAEPAPPTLAPASVQVAAPAVC